MSKFSDAFNAAKKSGKGIFKFNGRYYNTMTEQDNLDEFRKQHQDYNTYISVSDTGGAPNWRTDNWKITDRVIASVNKLNHVPSVVTQQSTTAPSVVTQQSITAPKQEQEEVFNPFNKYNFTDQDIRNFGNVRNIYNAYLDSFNSPYKKNSYIGFLRDYFGDRFKGNLNEKDFNSAMQEDFGMRGGIKGNDYKQGFGAFQGWLTAQKEKYLNNQNKVTPTLEKNNNLGGTDTRSQVVPGRVYGHKNGGIMQKFQQGGQMDPQQVLTQVAGMLAQDLGGTEQDAAQIMQSPEEFDNALSQVLSSITGQDVSVDDNNRDQAIAEYIKVKQEQQVQTAKKGAKIGYLKYLRGSTPKENKPSFNEDGGELEKESTSTVEFLPQSQQWINQLIEKLKVAFCEEMNAWYSYVITKPFLAGGERKEIAETYEKNGDDEYEDHAEWLLERLNQLNADVSDIASPSDWSKKTTKHPYRVPQFKDGNICAACNLQDQIKNELDAIETYRDLVSFTEGKDPVSHRKLREILADEEEHYQELKEHLTDVEFNTQMPGNSMMSKFILAITKDKRGGKLGCKKRTIITDKCGGKTKKKPVKDKCGGKTKKPKKCENGAPVGLFSIPTLNPSIKNKK